MGFARHRAGGGAQRLARASLARRQPLARAMHQLAAAGFGFLQDGGDVGIVAVKHFAQQKGCPLLGFEAFQQEQKGEGNVTVLLQQALRRGGQPGLTEQVAVRIGVREIDQRFRQPVADIGGALLLQLAQPVDA